MMRLHHLALSPFCRQIRLALAEKRIEVDLIDEYPWEARRDFTKLNPSNKVPVLRDNGVVISEAMAIFEYLEERYPEPALLPDSFEARAEARRLIGYFNDTFYHDVSRGILEERIYRRMKNAGSPESEIIKMSLRQLKAHFSYVNWLLEERRYIAGERFTQADFVAAAHISALDYVGDVDWLQFKHMKDWYAAMKSRPAFRGLLRDLVSGLRPTRQYTDLDFD